MLPVFPLGVKKDVDARAAWPLPPPPTFDAAARARRHRRRERGGAALLRRLPVAPRRGTTSALKLAGAGGDGAQTAAMLIARAAINEGFDATHIPSYGPESRGGTSYADVHVAERRGALARRRREPHVLVAFNAPSLAKFGPTVRAGRHRRLRQLGDRRAAAAPAGRAGGRGVPFTADRRRPRQGDGQEHRGARRAPGGDAALPAGDVPHRHPPGARATSAR